MEISQSTLNPKSATVLVVEDNDMTQMLLEVMLKRLNHRAILACDAKQALDILETNPVDLVLSDINMPSMDGIQLLEKIRSQFSYLHVPVVLMTAAGRTSLSNEAMKKGADGFLVHPFSSIELQQMVSRFTSSV